jgi:iron complex outermembrane receptor protein
MFFRSDSSLPQVGALALAIAALFPPAARAQAAPATATAEPVELPSITVVGRSASGSYHATESEGAKTELPLRELPQSVRVITQQTIDDLGATKLDDVLDYVGGVSRQNSFGGLWDNFAIRGLQGDPSTGMATLLNGFAANRGFNAPRDLAGVERIEFLKGPAAALYGSSEPGGTLNVVSKRPLWKPAHSVEGYLGSYGLRRGALDSTGPLSESLAYRLNVAVEERDSFRDHVRAERQVVAPALRWRLTPDTRLDYRGELLRHATPLDRGVVAVGGQLGAIPRSRFLGEPADGDVTVRNQSHQLVLSQDWGEAWSSRVGLSWRETALRGFSTEASALQPDGRTLWRQRRWRDYGSEDIALQAELQGRLSTGGVPHELLVGVEAYRYRMDTLMLRASPSSATPYAIDVLTPVYGQPQPVPMYGASTTDTREVQRNTALYLQDVVHLAPRWRLLAGLRVDDLRQSLTDHRTGDVAPQEPSATTPRVGLSWLPSVQWTVYANAGRSFRPNASGTAGRTFEPERGQALELGAKWESADQRLGATVALFDIRKRNVLTADPANSGASIAAGEVRSRGLELDLAGQLSTHWRLNASLALNDVEVSRDNDLEVGGRLLNVPRVNGSVLAVYEDQTAAGQRWGLGGGFTHVGRRLGEARTQRQANTGAPAFELPAYTTARLMGYWRVSPKLRLSLDVDNLFDRTHYASSFSRLWVTPGTARTVTAGLQAKF